MLLRIFLGASALLWLPYGVYCLLAPGALVEIAGVSSTTATGTIELRAMYGGLQSALGVLAGLALLRASLQRPALVALGFVGAGLFSARVLGAGLGAELSSYTAIALAIEATTAILALRLLGSLPAAGAEAL